MAVLTPSELEDISEKKTELLKEFLGKEPPGCKGDDIIKLWESIYDDDMKKAVVDTVSGLSNEEDNIVHPYEKLRAVVGDGGNWKWPRMWQKLDEIERRGPAYREGEVINFTGFNKNPNILKQKCLVVGGGPIGMRMAIELRMAGHEVILMEKRREIRDAAGELQQLGFTNRINRPHMWNYVRNDLEKFNGKDFMSRQACYPVFTEPETSSIGIDELQCLLLKNVLMMGVDFRLGVGYDNATVKIDPKTCKPQWAVECTYDKEAAEYFGMKEGKNVQIFDCLLGCDGPRSAVRETQQKHFGTIEKRKFMDCVGIVANVQKLSRKRLKELNYPHGQEPNDMNRTKMVFGPFFEKLREEADAVLQNFIYYKASYHNYIIITPTRDNLIKHGLSGKVYHFHAARAGSAQANEKDKLRTYVKKILQVGGIPLDPELSNDGFVNAPNDCMAFDFAECWNTKKSMHFELAPPDYDVEEHGSWEGPKLVPLVALAGDALLEPFWPLGLGLKRGWQAVMDTAYIVDNLYNRTMYCAELSKDPDAFSWDDHWEELRARGKENFDSCTRVEVAEDLGKGEYQSDSLVILQWKKMASDKEHPSFLVEIDPATRYKKRNQDLNSKYKRKMLDERAWVHPIVDKFMAIEAYTEKCKKDPDANGWKKLKAYGGKELGAKKAGGYKFKAPGAAAPANAKPFKLPTAEVQQVAEKKRNSLIKQVTSSQIDDHVTSGQKTRKSQMLAQQAGLLAQLKGPMTGGTQDDLHDLAYVPPSGSEGLAGDSHAMWDRMLEKGFSPAQTAELAHIRNMISALQTSVEGYRKAEKAILMGSKQ